MLTQPENERLRAAFASDGFAILPNVVSKQRLTEFRDEVTEEFARAERAGELFAGGGTVSGHLNCFPGEQSRFVYDSLRDYGIIDLVRQLSPQSARMPNVGCNLNLPGSSAQNYHVDGYASRAFMIVNVASVDTTLINGALEISPGSHQRDYKYHEFVLARRRSLRVQLNAGDVLLRPSSLWHRGMPNRSTSLRPMFGLTWEEGGSELEDPYTLYGGKMRFLPNRYTSDLSGRLREHAFAALPALGSGYLFVRSLLGNR
jgi:ectoine hydroxylase-related dioxygenase (phytanoyl-CoA dioxygenase family)